MLPTGLVTATVHLLGTDTPAAGKIIFLPTVCSLLPDAAGDVLYVSTRVEAVLDAAGRISVALPATDNPDVAGAAWKWSARFVLEDRSELPVLEFALAAGQVLDLADVVAAT